MRRNKRISKQASKTKTNKSRWLLKTGILIILIVGVYFGMRYVFHLAGRTLFPVKEIVFYGNKHLTDSELKGIMGLKGNEGLLGISSKEFSAKLLRSPWVKSVSFRKDFPDRFLIKIEEAVPFALLMRKGRTFFVDDAGDLLEEVKNDTIPFLPIISGEPFKDKASFLEALDLARAVKVKGLINLKNRIEIIVPPAGSEDISMQADGAFIKVGSGDYEDKIERLLELEGEIARRGIPVDYIDLRFANRVVVKPVNEVIR